MRGHIAEFFFDFPALDFDEIVDGVFFGVDYVFHFTEAEFSVFDFDGQFLYIERIVFKIKIVGYGGDDAVGDPLEGPAFDFYRIEYGFVFELDGAVHYFEIYRIDFCVFPDEPYVKIDDPCA